MAKYLRLTTAPIFNFETLYFLNYFLLKHLSTNARAIILQKTPAKLFSPPLVFQTIRCGALLGVLF